MMTEINGVGANQPLDQTPKQPKVHGEQRANEPIPMTSGGGALGASSLDCGYNIVREKDKSQAQIDADFEKSGLGLTREQVKQEKQKLGIGTSFLAKMAFNKGLGDKRTIAIHNEYAKQIFTEAYGKEDLMELAKKFINELPKAARKGQETEYRALCNQKLEAFRASKERSGLVRLVDKVDHNVTSQGDRVSEQVTETAEAVTQNITKNVNEHTDQVGVDIKQTVKDEGAQTRRAVHQEGAATRNTVREEAQGIKDHVTAETDRNIDANLQNMRALHGVDENNDEILDSGYTTDGAEIYHEDTTLGRGAKNTREIKDQVRIEHNITRETVREEGAKTRANQNQNAKLTAKRQTLSDMLMNEVNEISPRPGHYRDSTVKWLGGAADRVIGDTRLSQEQKEQALDELIRMVDEEIVISDGDKEKFNDTYFPKQPKK